MMRRSAFTLLELLLVLVLLGLMAGAATLKLVPLVQTGALEATLKRLEELDRLARHRARSARAASRLVFDFDGGGARQVDAAGNASGAPVRLGRCRLEEVRTHDGRWRSGTCAVNVSPLGLTQTYALRIRGGEGSTRWLLFAGLGGECEVIDDDSKVERVFAPLALPPRATGRGADAR